jgi:hypothetical protein
VKNFNLANTSFLNILIKLCTLFFIHHKVLRIEFSELFTSIAFLSCCFFGLVLSHGRILSCGWNCKVLILSLYSRLS